MKLELSFKSYGEAETNEAMDSLVSGELTMGKKVARFERMFAEYIGARHAVMVNSGSSANLLAVSVLKELGCLRAGMVLTMPALTWSTTLWPVLQNGLRVKLEDCSRKTLCSSNTGVAAHVMGNAAPGIALIEDCCEALGAWMDGRHVGTIGSVGTFSFYFSHHISTIEGGMLVTEDDDLADVARSMRAHGWSRGTIREGEMAQGIDPRFLFIHPGYNLRPTELQAAFGIHQLAKADFWKIKRQQVYAEMRSRLDGCGLFDFIEASKGCDPSWFAFPVLVRHGRRDALIRYLETRGIQTRPIIAGNLARHPAIVCREDVFYGPLPNADSVMTDGLYWGCHPGVDDAQIEYLVKTVETFLEQKEAA